MSMLKTPTLLAMTAASLFFAACTKDEPKSDNNPAPAKKAAPAGTADGTDKPTPATDPAVDPAEKTTAQVHCMGVNACKGKGGCKSEKNACKGQNGCKGQSFAELTEADCKTQGGTVQTM